MKGTIVALLALIVLLGGLYTWVNAGGEEVPIPKNQRLEFPIPSNSKSAIKLEFPAAKYPETAQHIKEAIAAGHSNTCTIDREGADHNRELSLKGVPTKKGKDRDEWPMAMCGEGGAGADIRYITPSDNRGAGSWVGHKLDDYPDGTRVEFIVK
ncbi:NucA/NucB deoxyribonuclease domain-containing protein [Paenibacillus kribbensis]|uniref:NucA/NucB deoxyribonuclease domain-containing protein n=1 Tax=Paenibacillus kribbensis TaxID=172713 RepID=UPI002DBE263A|nr:NucA/NucB deoxyribonuclease domain-containing protein [Paenibacillus kribbensis]MEC0234477.1 NucA/NucB deoxyribonuclease domain-containing protein [Paenibacillus kribbensis]